MRIHERDWKITGHWIATGFGTHGLEAEASSREMRFDLVYKRCAGVGWTTESIQDNRSREIS